MICTACNTLEPIQMLMNTTQCIHCGGRMEFTRNHGHFMSTEELQSIREQNATERKIQQHYGPPSNTGLGDVTGEPQNNGFWGMPDPDYKEEQINIADWSGETYDDDPDVGF